MSRQARILIGSFLLLASLGLSLYFWNKMADRVPIHFNGSGKADGYGSKSFALMVFPAFQFFFGGIYAFSLFMVQRPVYWKRKMRRPVSEQALEQMKNRGVRILDWAILPCMALFLDLQLESDLVTVGVTQRLTGLPKVFIGLMFVGVIYQIAQLLRIQYMALMEAKKQQASSTNPPPPIA